MDGLILNWQIAVAALLTLVPLLAAGFFGERLAERERRLPVWAQVLRPTVLGLPYLLVSLSTGTFHWNWFVLYLTLPVSVCILLLRARFADPQIRGNWRDFMVLGLLGLAVDLRWFEQAWPPHLAVFNKMLLLDLGIYGFMAVRRLDGVGFDLNLRLQDLRIGLREWCFFAPIAVALGLSLGFLHWHPTMPGLLSFAGGWLFTFLCIAVPEELFFRGWMQNLLERRMGRWSALLLTSALFGLSHFNKRAEHFNWRYVLLAAIAGIFYGRAWRQERRVGASAITHAFVDTVWGTWLR